MWCVPELNDEYIEKMEDVLETYEQPCNPAEPVVCLDEKPITLHAEVRSPSAAAPGREARRDSEYERCGTANVFCAVEPRAGHHFTFATPDRSAVQFAVKKQKHSEEVPARNHLFVFVHCLRSIRLCSDHFLPNHDVQNPQADGEVFPGSCESLQIEADSQNHHKISPDDGDRPEPEESSLAGSLSGA